MTTHDTVAREQKAASFSRKLGIALICAVLVVTLVIMKPAAPDDLDRKTASIFVPRSTLHDYIDIRQFMHDMRERVADTAGTRDGSSSGDH